MPAREVPETKATLIRVILPSSRWGKRLNISSAYIDAHQRITKELETFIGVFEVSVIKSRRMHDGRLGEGCIGKGVAKDLLESRNLLLDFL